MRKSLQGASLLLVAAVIIKGMSAMYRVPYQNMVGDEGFYVYQQIYPFYALVLAFMTTGFPVALSFLLVSSTTDEEAQQKEWTSWTGLFVLGILGWSLFFFGAGWWAALLRDDQLTPLFRVFSFLFWWLPFLSIIRGNQQARQDMMPTAVSQLVEQFVRMLVIVTGTYLLWRAGESVYTIGTVAIGGSVVGAFGAFLFLTFLLLFRRQAIFPRRLTKRSYWDSRFFIRVLVYAVVSVCTVSLFVLFQLVDALFIYQVLVETGMTEVSARIEKGVFDRGQPLLQIGLVIATSVALAFTPSLTKQSIVKKKKAFTLMVRYTIVLAVPATVGLLLLMKPINVMLFTNDLGTKTLQVLSLSLVFGSLAIVGLTVLQTEQRWRVLTGFLGGAFFVKATATLLLTAYWGTFGAAWATVIASVAVCIGVGVCLRPYIETIDFSVYTTVGQSVLVMGSIVAVIQLVWPEGDGRIVAGVGVLISAGVGAIVYFVMLWQTSFLSLSEKEAIFDWLQKRK